MTTVNYLPRWLRALRSGKYKQGKGELRTHKKRGKDRHCCLGVLCDIVDNKKWKRDINDDEYNYVYNRRDHYAMAPDDWFGGYVRSSEIQNQLMSMNDAGVSFKKIANWIEKNIDHVNVRKAT